MTAVDFPPTPEAPIFRPVAERAVQVEFALAFDPVAHDAVLRLDRTLAAHPFAGLREAVPAFVALLVVFDPVETDHAAVEAHLRRLLPLGQEATRTPALHEVEVCYDGELSPDLDAVAAQAGLSPEAVVEAHLSGLYPVVMYGFAPGYAYLGGLPDPIRLDRKPRPKRDVPAGSVLIAGAQCLISTLTMPTGWWIIGRSHTRVLTGVAERPFLFGVGDLVRFRRISRADFDRGPR